MTRLVLATRNRGKVVELERLLDGLGLAILPLDAYPGCPEVAETGDTFMVNACLKALAVANYAGELTLADDSGLEVEALGSEPGVRSARWAGPGADDAANNTKLLASMWEIPEERRGARFVSVVAVARPGVVLASFTGVCEGSIAPGPRGSAGFGYDPLFVPRGQGRSYAELDLEEKNRISHRGKAFRQARAWLQRYLAGGGAADEDRRPERYPRESGMG